MHFNYDKIWTLGYPYSCASGMQRLNTGAYLPVSANFPFLCDSKTEEEKNMIPVF